MPLRSVKLASSSSSRKVVVVVVEAGHLVARTARTKDSK